MTEHSAGAVLFTMVDGVPHYVLVQEMDGHIGLPKGHIEAGETVLDTAMREIREEVGLKATLLSSEPMWTDFYALKNGNDKQVDFFLACYDNQTPTPREGEIARVLVLPLAQAQQALTRDSFKGFLAHAEQYIRNYY